MKCIFNNIANCEKSDKAKMLQNEGLKSYLLYHEYYKSEEDDVKYKEKQELRRST